MGKASMTVYKYLILPMVLSIAPEGLAAQITDTQTKFSMVCVAEKGAGFAGPHALTES
jgi:hypothetical protein